MPNLPYHEDNQVHKNQAFNDIVSWSQEFLDGALTSGEFASKVMESLLAAGVKWDQDE
jgi:hypothetical protein